jgi:hypothetical protein
MHKVKKNIPLCRWVLPIFDAINKVYNRTINATVSGYVLVEVSNLYITSYIATFRNFYISDNVVPIIQEMPSFVLHITRYTSDKPTVNQLEDKG